MRMTSSGRHDVTSIAEILRALDAADVRYLLIGGYASVIHGIPRTTVDLDIAVPPTAEDLASVIGVLRHLGLESDTDRPDEILGQGGVSCSNARNVDVVTSLATGSFDEFWQRRLTVTFQGIEVSVISRRDQIRLLRATGRPGDLEDADALVRLGRES